MWVNDECLRLISVGFVNLTDLTMVSYNNVTDEGIASLALCLKLVGLRLRSVSGINGKGLLSLLSGCPSLRLLHVRDMDYMTDLEWLDFIGTDAQIEILAIRDCKQIGEAELCRLGRRGWCDLREFSLDRSLPPNAPPRQYGELFRAWKFEDLEGTEYCPNLEALSLRNCISMPGTGLLWILSQCKALRRLEICLCDGVRDDEVCQFTKNNPQMSSIFWISRSRLKLTNQIFMDIGKNCRHLLSLRVLDFSRDGRFGPGFFYSGMGALVEGCTQLRALSLQDVPCFGDRTAAAIAHSTSLEDLEFCNCKDLNDDMLLISANVTTLTLAKCPLPTDKSLDKCSNVTRLTLISCPLLTGKFLKKLGSSRHVSAHLIVDDCPGISKAVALNGSRWIRYTSFDSAGQ